MAAARQSIRVGECAFCPSDRPRWYVVGAGGIAVLICTDCVVEAKDFGVADHDWRSYRRLRRAEWEAVCA
jgi:hypothetical protein